MIDADEPGQHIVYQPDVLCPEYFADQVIDWDDEDFDEDSAWDTSMVSYEDDISMEEFLELRRASQPEGKVSVPLIPSLPVKEPDPPTTAPVTTVSQGLKPAPVQTVEVDNEREW